MSEISIINEFSKNPTSENMDILISLAEKGGISDDGIVELANKLAFSGKIFRLPKNHTYCDIPSTGGPSSLSTLICPLLLSLLGYFVPKLGVPGRPAGGIDVLAQIPNYNIHHNTESLIKCLELSNYCHFLVNDDFAPLDKILFDYRSKKNAKNIAILVIASILGKKKAVGLDLVGLDVRVSTNGNFGENREIAKLNSVKFIKAASKMGIKAKCFLTNNNVLMQPFLGRGESLVALSTLFNKKASEILQNHFLQCVDMSMNLVGAKHVPSLFDTYNLKNAFERNVISQGGKMSDFQSIVNRTIDQHKFIISAEITGFLKIDLSILRDKIVYFQNLKNDTSQFKDPCGIIFNKYSNNFVEKGDTILTYRIQSEHAQEFSFAISMALTITPEYPISNDYEIIENYG